MRYSDPLLVAFLGADALKTSLPPLMQLEGLLERFSLIPYENLTKVIAAHDASAFTAKQSPEDIIGGFLAHGTGGTCFPLTLTLARLLSGIGFSAAPILADRRYGSDTHCALLVQISPPAWHLLDPGYLITKPVEIPSSHPHRIRTGCNELELRPHVGSDRLDLVTIHGDNARYRLTYKLTPVDSGAFHQAWDSSFTWDMMTYPVVCGVRNGEQIYVQKNRIFTQSTEMRSQREFDRDTLAREISQRLGIALPVVQRAFSYLSRAS